MTPFKSSIEETVMDMVRVRFVAECNLWVVEVYSPITKDWMVQGEHRTEEAARRDAASW
jgi:hypothetical protein